MTIKYFICERNITPHTTIHQFPESNYYPLLSPDAPSNCLLGNLKTDTFSETSWALTTQRKTCSFSIRLPK